jgi:hypothetical protein
LISVASGQYFNQSCHLNATSMQTPSDPVQRTSRTIHVLGGWHTPAPWGHRSYLGVLLEVIPLHLALFVSFITGVGVSKCFPDLTRHCSKLSNLRGGHRHPSPMYIWLVKSTGNTLRLGIGSRSGVASGTEP